MWEIRKGSVDQAADPAGHIFQGIPEAAHFLRTLFDHHFEHIGESSIFANQIVVFESSLGRDEEISIVPRFRDELVDTGVADGVNGHFQVPVGGQENTNGLWADVVRGDEEVDPVHIGHLVVSEDQVWRFFTRHRLQLFEGVCTIYGFRDVVTPAFEQVP